MENSPVRLEHGGDHLTETSLSNKPSKQPVSSETQSKRGMGESSTELTQTSTPPRDYPAAHSVSFQVDEQTGQVVIRLVDPDSGEVVREIPPEALRRLATVLDDIKGLLLDATA